MLRTRIIPCLQLIGNSLVKTVKFDNHNYIGDPINTVRIFNELEVDELCFLDIRASLENRKPNFNLLAEIANECFMPLSYGGGVKDTEVAKEILSSVGLLPTDALHAQLTSPFDEHLRPSTLDYGIHQHISASSYEYRLQRLVHTRQK